MSIHTTARIAAQHVRPALGPRIHTLCPAWRQDGHPIHTATSVVLPGRIGDIAAVAKWPLPGRRYWQVRALHEIKVYAALEQAGRPPLPLPRLLASDPSAPLLIVTRLPGRPLGDGLLPSAPLIPEAIESLLDAADLIHGWTGTGAPVIPVDVTDGRRIDALPFDLFPRRADRRWCAAAADRLAASIGVELEHGDIHAANVIADAGAIGLCDLEFMARRLPGYDYATIWAVCGPDETLRERVRARVGTDAGRRAAWDLNLMIVLGREILSHRRRRIPTDLAHARLAWLHADFDGAYSRLRRHL